MNESLYKTLLERSKELLQFLSYADMEDIDFRHDEKFEDLCLGLALIIKEIEESK